MKLFAALRQTSRLGIKLFVIILSVNVAISAGVFMAVSHSIDRGFFEYLNQAQERRAQVLAEGLQTRWQYHQGWAWLADELDVSSQAASERVRRGLDSLVEEALLSSGGDSLAH